MKSSFIFDGENRLLCTCFSSRFLRGFTRKWLGAASTFTGFEGEALNDFRGLSGLLGSETKSTRSGSDSISW